MRKRARILNCKNFPKRKKLTQNHNPRDANREGGAKEWVVMVRDEKRSKGRMAGKVIMVTKLSSLWDQNWWIESKALQQRPNRGANLPASCKNHRNKPRSLQKGTMLR